MKAISTLFDSIDLYSKRIVVEQTYSRLQVLFLKEARYYLLTDIRNENIIDYRALSLFDLAAITIKKHKKI